MAYLVSTLITRAFNLSGIVGLNLETVQPDESNTGLYLLNALLTFKASDDRLIPYFQQYDLTFVAGQEMYYVPNLVYAETMTFNIGPVRYSMLPQGRKDYFGTGRTNNISSLPFLWHYERTLDGSNVYVYFLPANTYSAAIWGKFGLSEVTLTTDLSLTYDEYYIDYLRYGLAEYICNEYDVDVPPQVAQMLRRYEAKLLDTSQLDLSVNKLSSFRSPHHPDLYLDANLAFGWRP